MNMNNVLVYNYNIHFNYSSQGTTLHEEVTEYPIENKFIIIIIMNFESDKEIIDYVYNNIYAKTTNYNNGITVQLPMKSKTQ